MIPQKVPNPRVEPVDACSFADRWGIDLQLAGRVIAAAGDLPFDVWIFSGSRSQGLQEDISDTPFAVSTHADRDNGCDRLSTGADVQPVSPANRSDLVVVAQMGAAFVRHGLRWGGGARIGPDGIPRGAERWHVDLGPRAGGVQGIKPTKVLRRKR